MKDEIVQYFVVNSELNMSAGKIATQVAHVATLILLETYKADKLDAWHQWFDNYQTKIILKGKEKELLKLIEMGAWYIQDIGRTEIPEGSLTCVGFTPRPRSEMKKLIGRLRLL